jgi:hypothetical protein
MHSKIYLALVLNSSKFFDKLKLFIQTVSSMHDQLTTRINIFDLHWEKRKSNYILRQMEYFVSSSMHSLLNIVSLENCN